jgi:hypothetical protein
VANCDLLSGMLSKSGSGRALGSGEFWYAPPAQRSCFDGDGGEAEAERSESAANRSTGSGGDEDGTERVGLARKCCGESRNISDECDGGGVCGSISGVAARCGGCCGCGCIGIGAVLVVGAAGAAGRATQAEAAEVGIEDRRGFERLLGAVVVVAVAGVGRRPLIGCALAGRDASLLFCAT